MLVREREKHSSCDSSVCFVPDFNGLVPRDQNKSSEKDRFIRPKLDDRKKHGPKVVHMSGSDKTLNEDC